VPVPVVPGPWGVCHGRSPRSLRRIGSAFLFGSQPEGGCPSKHPPSIDQYVTEHISRRPAIFRRNDLALESPPSFAGLPVGSFGTPARGRVSNTGASQGTKTFSRIDCGLSRPSGAPSLNPESQSGRTPCCTARALRTFTSRSMVLLHCDPQNLPCSTCSTPAG